MSDLLKKNLRKRVIVKNAYFDDIDSVTDKHGNDDNYSEWLIITKQYLKKREEKALEIKKKEIELIINSNKEWISNNNNLSFRITENMMNNTKKELYSKIDEWKGAIINKILLIRYRDYVNAGKNWWDLQKKKIMGTAFWFNIFKHIEQFVDRKEPKLFNILKVLFVKKITFTNTKYVPLVNAAEIVYSKDIQIYLLNLNKTLTIKKWIISHKMHSRNRIMEATKIMNKLQLQLKEITKTKKNNNNSLNNNNTNNTISVNQRHQIKHYGNNQNQNKYSISGITTKYRSSYRGYHKASYLVSDLRYSPIHKVLADEPVIILIKKLAINNNNTSTI